MPTVFGVNQCFICGFCRLNSFRLLLKNKTTGRLVSPATVSWLVRKLAATKAKGATVALALGKEFPAGGFSFLKPGNGIPAVLGFGNQVRIHEWYGRLDDLAPGIKKWGGPQIHSAANRHAADADDLR